MPSTKSPKTSPGKKGKVKYAKAAKGKAKGERDACPGQNQKTRRASVGPRGQSQSCHQCRQSIHSSKGVSEVKSGQERIKCSTCTRYWCEQCLQNRYGIAPGSLERASWSCPVCSKNCNCSICQYSTDAESGDVYSHCTTGGGHVHPCSVRVPLDLGSHGVISAEATSLGLHSGIAAVDVKVSCEPRAWIYALMVVAPVVIAMIFCSISACVCGYIHYNRPQPAARGRDPAAGRDANPGRYNRLQPADGGRNPAAGGDANPGIYNRPQPAEGGRDPPAGGVANPGRYNRLQPAEGGRDPVAAAAVLANRPCNYRE